MDNKKQNSNQLGHFRNVAGEQAYKQSYEAAMKTLPAPVRTLDVVTDYGAVRVYEFSDGNAGTGLAPIFCYPAAHRVCLCGVRILQSLLLNVQSMRWMRLVMLV